jgi:predicted lipoprotein with Yx(FWY)xxD motif
MKRLIAVLGAVALGLSVFTACGGDGEGGAASDGAAKLATDDVANLGKIVVDGNGRTVYVFDKDTADPSKSNCDGDCAAKWPPVMAGSGTPELDGVDASLVGTVTRSDGSKQLTLAGWPLYLFASDTKAGEAKGQAVGGVWWVVGPDGKKNTTKLAEDSGQPGY